MKVDAAQQRLQTLLKDRSSLHRKAAIYYEQWQLDKGEKSRLQARRAYQSLLQHSATATARQRTLELGATNLPPLPAAPPLPVPIIDTPLDLNSLLEKARQSLVTIKIGN